MGEHRGERSRPDQVVDRVAVAGAHHVVWPHAAIDCDGDCFMAERQMDGNFELILIL